MTQASQATARRRRASRGAGDQLRDEIIAATRNLLAVSANSDTVSIRAVADAVRVTPPSIYLHFADKDALIEAVVSDVFAELDAAMVAAGASVEHPLGKLRAFGLAYVRFAVEHPEHYRVATMERCPTEGQPGHLDQILADSAFAHLVETVRLCQDADIFAAGDPLPVALQMWAAAHGIASLMIAKPFLPWGDLERAAESALLAAALGKATGDLIGAASLGPEQVAAWVEAQKAATK
jgi:AcrR family transcriptional regulator